MLNFERENKDYWWKIVNLKYTYTYLVKDEIKFFVKEDSKYIEVNANKHKNFNIYYIFCSYIYIKR